MIDDQFDPLFGAAPKEIPLPSAPLVSVLCQVRFTEIISIQQKSFIASFQEHVRPDYPLMRAEKLKTIAVDEQGASVTVSDENIWRFIDAAKGWRLSLTSAFFALETRRYTSRADFIDRLGKAIAAAQATIKPTHVTRIGMRYVDRVDLQDQRSMDKMLRPEMFGIAGSSLRKNMNHTISEISCQVKEGQLTARWGMLPPRGTHDPEIMPPIASESWFLDLDTSSDHQASPIGFDSDMIRNSAMGLASRAYSFFRWAVTEQFLTAFGGKTK